MNTSNFPLLDARKNYLISSVGIPFSGKTEYLTKHNMLSQANYLSFDEVLTSCFSDDEIRKLTYSFAVDIVHTRLQEFVEDSQCNIICYDAMNITLNERTTVRHIARNVGRVCLFIYLPISPEVAIQRMYESMRTHIPEPHIHEADSLLDIHEAEKDIITVR